MRKRERKSRDAWQSNHGKGYTAKDAARVFYTERRNMTRERLDMLVGLVLQCRSIEDIDVSISIEKYGMQIYIWTRELIDGIKMTIYQIGQFAHDGINEQDKTIRSIIDPDLRMAEKRIRDVLKEAENVDVG